MTITVSKAELANPRWAGFGREKILRIKRKRIRNLKLAITGVARSEEVRQQISDTRRENQRAAGIPFSPYFKNVALFARKDGSWGVCSRELSSKCHARCVYEKFHGEIPKGFIVHHIDGDKKNDKPRNLYALSRKDHIDLHWFWKAIEAWEGKKVSGRRVFRVFLKGWRVALS
jgi:hypothetical protein